MPVEVGYAAYLRDLPADWQSAPISEVARVVGGGTPSRDVAQFWRGSIPWVTPSEVSSENAVRLSDTREHISAAGLAGSGATLLPAGSLMVTTRATLGACAINAVPMTTNQGFKSLVFLDPGDSPFFYYLVDKLKPELKRRASGTIFLEVSASEVGGIRLPLPPKGERAKIAQILDTLDTTMRQTEAVIEKLKQVKRGLLHDLLTRGIDHNGELRPPPREAPRLYKESTLGWIPIDWQVEVLENLVEPNSPITYGVVKPGPEVDGGVPFVRGGDIFGGRILINQLRTIGSDVSRQYGRTLLRGGELLMSLVGYPGEVAVAPESLTGANIARQAALIRLGAKANAIYVMHYLFSQGGKKQVLASSLGSAQQVVNLGDLRVVRVPLPRPAEQLLICQRLAAADARLESENESLAKLTQLKSGLIDDLLTGRVRVTPLISS